MPKNQNKTHRKVFADCCLYEFFYSSHEKFNFHFLSSKIGLFVSVATQSAICNGTKPMHTKIEDHLCTMIHITAVCASFVRIYGLLYGVLPISLESGQI
jgi:hypothetical protein